MTFTKEDVDEQNLKNSVLQEAEKIFQNNPRGRSYHQVYADTEKGHVAERYLIEKCGYTNNHKIYHDVIDHDGNEIEIKVIDKRYCNKYFIETDPNKYNLSKWRQNYRNYNSAKYVMIFSFDDGIYEYFDTYDVSV